MDRAAADALLADVELVPAVEGAVAAARELERRLLEQDIPAMLAKPEGECCATGGCATKLQVLVREEDVPRLGQLLREEWLAALAREGTLGEGLTALGLPQRSGDGTELACPACGFSGPLVDGACGDCGLQLE